MIERAVNNLFSGVRRAAEILNPHRMDVESTRTRALIKDSYYGCKALLRLRPDLSDQPLLPGAIESVAEGWYTSRIENYRVIAHPETGLSIAIAELVSVPDPLLRKLRLGPEELHYMVIMEEGARTKNDESELMILQSGDGDHKVFGAVGSVVEIKTDPPKVMGDVNTRIPTFQDAQRYRQLILELLVDKDPVPIH